MGHSGDKEEGGGTHNNDLAIRIFGVLMEQPRVRERSLI
jgi:hypothetical protein